jgi:hypothetical protein
MVYVVSVKGADPGPGELGMCCKGENAAHQYAGTWGNAGIGCGECERCESGGEIQTQQKLDYRLGLVKARVCWASD